MKRIASRICCLLALVLTVTPIRPAAALVVSPMAAANAAAPAGNPGWDNVGDNGIYVGNRWVLTAYHVVVNGIPSFTFPGIGTFNPQPGASFRLTNPTGLGLSQYTDLFMFQLDTDPGLPALSLGSATPGVGAEVMLISDGNSVAPGTPQTGWQGTLEPMDPDWTVNNDDPEFAGYVSNVSFNDHVKLWGTNRVEDDGTADPDHNIVFDIGYGHVITFASIFDDPDAPSSNATASEAQAMTFDSGGAAFHKDGDTWRLAGVTDAIGTYPNQPNALSTNVGQTAVFGNATFYVDLSFYSDQILAVPEAGAYLLMSAVAATASLARIIARRRAK